MRFINPKTDFAFKRIFGGPESKNILMSFLNAMIYNAEPVIEDLEIIDPYQAAQIMGLKDTYLDVKARLNDGSLVIIEMQVLNVEAFGRRILYNAAKAYSTQLYSGENYGILKKVIALTITDFIMFPETENIITHFVFKELTNNLIYKKNDIDLIFIELPKFKGNIDTLKSLTDKWIYFLKEAEKLETIPENMVTVETIKQAFQIANRTNLTREELEDLQKRELFIHDQQAMKIQAEKEGMEKGREETRKEIALNLLKNNMNIQEIAKITGLSVEEIQLLNS